MTANTIQYLLKQNSAPLKNKQANKNPTKTWHHCSVMEEAPGAGFKSEHGRCPPPRPPSARAQGKEGQTRAVSTTIKQSLSEADRGSPFPLSPAASAHPRRPGRGGRRDRPLRQGPAPTVRQLHSAGAAQGPRQAVELLHGSLHPRSGQPGAADTPRCRPPSAHRGAGGAQAAPPREAARMRGAGRGPVPSGRFPAEGGKGV